MVNFFVLGSYSTKFNRYKCIMGLKFIECIIHIPIFFIFYKFNKFYQLDYRNKKRIIETVIKERIERMYDFTKD